MQRSDSSLGVLALAFGLIAPACYSGAATGSGASTGSAGDSEDPAPGTGSDGGAEAGASEAGATGDPPELPEVPAPTLRRLTAAEFTPQPHRPARPRHALGRSRPTPRRMASSRSATPRSRSRRPASRSTRRRSTRRPRRPSPTPRGSPRRALRAGAGRPTSPACATRSPASDAGPGVARSPPRSSIATSAIATSVGTETGDAVVGLRHAVWGLLQSPYFLYRVELGAPSPDDADGRVKFSSYEMASRLSFTLWNTVPDEALLDAAERDELVTADGIAAQAKRMLADPRARQGVAQLRPRAVRAVAARREGQGPGRLPGVDADPARRDARGPARAHRGRRVQRAGRLLLALRQPARCSSNNELALLYGLPAVDPDAFRAGRCCPEDARAAA